MLKSLHDSNQSFNSKVEYRMRFFNTAGPVTCEGHYCLPPLERFDLAEVLMLIEQKKYLVLHAPRQVGKTTFRIC